MNGAGGGHFGSARTGIKAIVLVLVSVLAFSSCSRVRYKTRPGFEVGLASWYGPQFQGRPTSSGEIFDMNDLTAAHKTLPFGTYVMVTNLENDRTAVVRINDRGPFIRGRIIDLSFAAARVLGAIGPGVIRVRLDVIKGRQATSTETGRHTWFVQVGAFTVQENAYQLKKILESSDMNAAVSVFKTALAVYYRVRLKASSRDEAVLLARKLADAGYQAVIAFE